jgi:hypothetical protein
VTGDGSEGSRAVAPESMDPRGLEQREVFRSDAQQPVAEAQQTFFRTATLSPRRHGAGRLSARSASRRCANSPAKTIRPSSWGSGRPPFLLFGLDERLMRPSKKRWRQAPSDEETSASSGLAPRQYAR